MTNDELNKLAKRIENLEQQMNSITTIDDVKKIDILNDKVKHLANKLEVCNFQIYLM